MKFTKKCNKLEVLSQLSCNITLTQQKKLPHMKQSFILMSFCVRMCIDSMYGRCIIFEKFINSDIINPRTKQYSQKSHLHIYLPRKEPTKEIYICTLI